MGWKSKPAASGTTHNFNVPSDDGSYGVTNMAERTGQDFVWVRPVEGKDNVTIVNGRLTVRASHAEPARVTRGEWDVILKRRGVLETCDAPSARKVLGKKSKGEK